MWKLLNIITDHSAVSGERDQKEDQQQFDDHRQPHLRSWFCKARHGGYVRRVIDILRRLLSKYARTRAPVRHSHPRSRESRPCTWHSLYLPYCDPAQMKDSNERSRASMHVNIISISHFFPTSEQSTKFSTRTAGITAFCSRFAKPFVPLSRSFLEWNNCQLLNVCIEVYPRIKEES